MACQIGFFIHILSLNLFSHLNKVFIKYTVFLNVNIYVYIEIQDLRLFVSYTNYEIKVYFYIYL